MGKSHRVCITNEEANYLGLEINPSGFYRLSKKNHIKVLKYRVDNRSGKSVTVAINKLRNLYDIHISEEDDFIISTETNQYKNKPDETPEDFYRKISAWNERTNKAMDIDEYCEFYGFPREDIHSYKLVSHTGTPYYNIAFKERLEKTINEEIDFDSITAKYTANFTNLPRYENQIEYPRDFDSLTYTDLHIGMEPDLRGNSMTPVTWEHEDIMNMCYEMVEQVAANQKSVKLVVDDLGDFLDGLNGYTTRGGHKLPQKLSNEECYDLGIEFKMTLAKELSRYYDHIIFNNICNDNHSGVFSYFVNQHFKSLAEAVLDNVEVHNHRQFLNHYVIGEFVFIITHGKDDEHKKFGFQVNPKPDTLSFIDQYIKMNNLYKLGKKIIVKKGDSHQALMDMCSSKDFWYFNYPSAAPNSQWIETNFGTSYRGFFIESFIGTRNSIDPIFY